MGLLLGSDIAGGDHRHSHLGFKARAGVLDSLICYQLGLARMVADAALLPGSATYKVAVPLSPAIVRDAILALDAFTTHAAAQAGRAP